MKTQEILDRYNGLGESYYHRNCLGTAFYLLGMLEKDSFIPPFETKSLLRIAELELSTCSIDGGLVIFSGKWSEREDRILHAGVSILYEGEWQFLNRPTYNTVVDKICPLESSLDELRTSSSKICESLDLFFLKVRPAFKLKSFRGVLNVFHEPPRI